MPSHTTPIGIRVGINALSACAGTVGATANYVHVGTHGPAVTMTGPVSVIAGSLPPGMTPYVCLADASTLYLIGTPTGGLGLYSYTLRATLSNASTADFSVTDHLVSPSPYVITSVSPRRGSWEGGQTVHIYGTGLGDIETVQFGLQEATNIVHLSSTEITCVTPKSGTGRAIVNIGVNGVPTLFDYTYVVGVSLDFDIRRDPDITIEAQRNDAPSSATFRVQTDEPLIGQHTTITDPATRTDLHTGTVVRTQQVYQEGDLTWMTTTKDDSWLLDRRRPFGSWGKDATHPDGWPADEVAEYIRANYTDGFTGTRIQAGLPPITISFDGTQPFSACMTAICQAAGGLIWNAEGRDILLGYDTGTIEVTDTFAGNATMEARDSFTGDGSTVTFALTQPLLNDIWPRVSPDYFGSVQEQLQGVPSTDPKLYATVATYREGRIGKKSPAQVPTAPVVTEIPWTGPPLPPEYATVRPFNVTNGFMRVAYLFNDGTESFVGPRSNIFSVAWDKGWSVTIPTGGAGVIGRRIYFSFSVAQLPWIEQAVMDVTDNTTTTVSANGNTVGVDYTNVGLFFRQAGSNNGSSYPIGFPSINSFEYSSGDMGVHWQYDPVANSITKGAASIGWDSWDQVYVEPANVTPGPPSGGGQWVIGIGYNTPNPAATSTFALRAELVLSPVTGLIGLGYVSYNNGFGSVDEPITAPAGGGVWTYDSITNSITRTTGAPATPLPSYTSGGQLRAEKNISFTYYTGNGLETTDIDNDMLLMDPPPIKTVEGTQIRNRVLVLGVGTTTRAFAPAGGAGFLLNDSSMFKVGSLVRTGADVYTVTAITYGTTSPSIVLDPVLVRNYEAGTQVRLYAVHDDLDAQADLALREDGDGVHEGVLSFTSWLIPDTVLDTVPGTRATAEIAALNARGLAELATWAWPVESITYATRDQNTKSGALVVWNMTNPPIVGTYKIQTVRIDQINIGTAGDTVLEPRFTVTASAVRFEFSDLLRKVLISDASGGGSTSGGSFSGGGGGAGGGGSAHLIPEYWGEVPSGAIDGANAVFTLSHAYRPGNISVYKNGLRTHDFTETSESTFTMGTAPKAGDSIIVDSRGY